MRKIDIIQTLIFIDSERIFSDLCFLPSFKAQFRYRCRATTVFVNVDLDDDDLAPATDEIIVAGALG